MSVSDRSDRHVAILGAGPVGLEAALAASDAGHAFTLYEAAPRPAAHVRAWGHVRLFSPWELNVSPRMRRHLGAAGVPVPEGGECPTGAELVERLLEPVARLPEVAAGLRLESRVRAVGREGLLKHEAVGSEERGGPPFRILVEGADGGERVDRADVVLDCTGTYGRPLPLGDGGIPAPGERELSGAIRRTIPDLEAEREEWAGRTVLLVGAGHSAQTAARDLAALPDTRVVWAIRDEDPDWRGVPDDPLPERARLIEEARALVEAADSPVRLHPGVVVHALRRADGEVEVELRDGRGRIETVRADRILSLTGYAGDPGLYRELQVHECWATGGLMRLSGALMGQDGADCLSVETPGAEALASPEPDFFILGMKSYGRNRGFLMRTGWEQADQVLGGPA